MEMALQLRGSLYGPQLKIKPALLPSSKSRAFKGIRATPCVASSSDYWRRRRRKSAIPKVKVSNSKGFMPKPQAGTSTQKKGQSRIEEKVGHDSGKSKLDIQSSISSSTVERRVETLEEAEEANTDVEGTFDEVSAEMPCTPLRNVEKHRQKADFEEDSNGLRTHQGLISYGDESVAEFERWNELEVITGGAHLSEVNPRTSTLFFSSSDVKSSKSGTLNDIECAQDQVGRVKLTREDSIAADGGKEDQELKAESDVDICETEESLAKQKEHVDLQAQRKLLEDLAEENLTRGNKVFVLPEVVKADRVIEVFLNRSLSSLVNEHEVLIKGAFNGGRWQSFTENLHKTDLRGDWWSCNLYVPKEAYQIDFVFFNDSNVYENNSSLDFSGPVEGGLDESGFENFLLEEKQRELERLAAEKAERERQAEDQRRRESENAAIEADPTQAKIEVQKKREAIHQVMKLATKSVDIQSSISSSTVERGVETLEEAEEVNTDVEGTFDEEASTEIPSTPLSDVEKHRQKADFEEDSNGLRTHQGVISYGYESMAGLERWNEVEVITGGAHHSQVNPRTASLFVSSSDVKSSKSGTLDDIEGAQDQVGRAELTREDSLVADGGKKDQELKAESDVDICETEESLAKQKEHVDLQAQRKLLEDLAEENLTRGNKVFVLPEVVKADRVIEVFLNRSLSSLVNEHTVLIKGAFNGGRWQSFTEKLHKTDLRGDWWSCHLYVPKEAYQIDFVFFNDSNVYENNSLLDFLVHVEGGLDESGFENFLLEEKQRELERLAAEKAEWKRQAEDECRREAEKAAIEADQAQAKIEVQRKRGAIHQVMKLATKSVDNLWHIEPNMFKGEDKVRLYYNRSARPLQYATEIWIHGGYNNWSDGLSFIERLHNSEEGDGDWWYAEVVIPDGVLVLDWVFADGLPHKARVYDNDNSKDFHAIVPKDMSEELYWVEEEHRIYRKLREERKLKEEAAGRKAEKTALMKAQRKEKSMKRFLLSQKNIVYTDPLEVRAGKLVTVLYNPSSTVLSGKPEVWFRCSFNRWTHRNGPLRPQKMESAVNGVHVQVTVSIPMDAYEMDFVFSEKEDGGIYDNNNGMDYHIHVVGGIMKEPPMHVVHVSVEMAPIAKVGGLGDVVTSLSRAVQELGHKVDNIFPKYDCMNLSNVKDFHFRQSFAWGGAEIKVWFGKVEDLSVYFLEPQNGMFSAGCIYGRNNDGDRFGFFSHAALEFLLQSGIHPDIIHCHDWSTAPVAWLFKEHYRHYGMSNARVIFTIHNLEFGAHHIAKAMIYTDKATTVSQTYLKEVSGNPLISPHLYKFHGIVNGIDPDIWDPYNDDFIPVAYTSENVVEGKRAAKEALQQRLGLRKSDYPLVGIITRLTVQKGIHLIKHAIWRALERNGQVVLLGSAPDPRIQNEFVNLANQLHSSHADRARLCLAYDEPLSHLIYAGSDFILVPSLFEPCGLTQLIAMRYGAIPVVRKTGGLYDTVFDVDNDKERAQAQGLEPNGFSFDGAEVGGVDYALNRAITAWHDGREWFISLCKCVMDQDWSWNCPALNYIELYHQAHK